MRELAQHVLEEELAEFRGRAKSACHSDTDKDSGYRNGYARADKLALSSGTREVSIRNIEENLESRLAPLFTHKTS